MRSEQILIPIQVFSIVKNIQSNDIGSIVNEYGSKDEVKLFCW